MGRGVGKVCVCVCWREREKQRKGERAGEGVEVGGIITLSLTM